MAKGAELEDRFMSVRDIEEYTGLSDRTVRELVKKMDFVRSSKKGKILVRRSEVDRYFEQQRKQLRSADPVVKEFLGWISNNGRKD